ncbi:Putative Tail specific protease, ClpP/crotonase-like domain superfamily [Colletotrichum destructivum]|uniref:Tail specific protease, ClpP/crotonase-like domain superfamily n=1 Tax=Colletotrichum destructivum TaxID=34406 RepID=A0AAX4J421_9PEZI|nr:Putative Tail specific protease, ClpP/crotonase-like domain superfamily [Colletotrichum destructivum]
MKSLLALASAALAAAQNATTQSPCAVVASQLAISQAAEIAAIDAFNCLNSVPVDTQGNSKLIDELKQLWQFHSEIVWLKNPGSDWEYGPLDIMAELDKIKSNLESYESEYAVQLAIQNLTVRTGNFHFNYSPDILSVFSFRRRFEIASISSDGKALPKLYFNDDVAALADGDDGVFDIESINGMKPYDFLQANLYSQYINSDGRMNNMFAKGDTKRSGAFVYQDKYDGNSTDVVWSNSKQESFSNYATTRLSFEGVDNGETFFKTFCTGAITGAKVSASDDKDKEVISPGILGPVPTIPTGSNYLSSRTNKRQSIPSGGAYANAVAEAKTGTVAGYFLKEGGFSDVAVLKIISFSNPDSRKFDDAFFSNDFQATIQSFLEQCIAQNKQKLIIDLRENGGGDTNLLIDAFMQLFPDMDPFSGQRYRATDAFNKIGDVVNEVYTNSDLATKFQATVGQGIVDGFFFRYWAWWHFRTAEGNNFDSWDEFNGPHTFNNDKFTTTFRYNYSNADRVSVLPDGFNFVNGSRPTAFQPSNVVMFTDALCGSSCASFHEELKNIAGVKAVTVGGRPENKPIETVAGTKGGEVIPLFQFSKYAKVALQFSSTAGLSSVQSNDSTLSAVANVPNIAIRVGDSSSRAQSQDQIRKGDETATPLQYIYEAADCRIFYTAKSFADPVEAWKQVWSAYSDNSKCVEGSTGDKSSISGGYKLYGSAEVKPEDEPPAYVSTSGENTARSTQLGSLGIAFLAVVFAILI